MQPIKVYNIPQIEVTLNSEQVVVNVQESGTPVDVTVGGKNVYWGQIGGTLSNQADLQTALDSKVDENPAITGATKTKITYDSKGLVTSGTDAGISDITGLQTALDLKVPYTGATGNVTLGEYGITGGYYQFDTTPTTYNQAVGNLGWNDTDGTIEFLLKGGNVDMTIGEKMVARVVNGTGDNVLKSNYQVVKITGAQGQRLQVNLAQANNDANSADTLGLIAENINNNNQGFIVTSGLIEEINTTGSLQSETWNDGDILYLSGTTAGKITNVKPQAPTHTVIVGFVVYAHQNHGKIFVKIDNGYELDELHNVKINTGTLSNGQVLKYNSTLGVWENNTDAAGTGTVTQVNATGGTGISVSGSPITTTGTLTITNTAPDQTVVLTQGGTTTITGTYPNFTISSADQYTGTVTSVSALTLGTSGTDLSSTVANGTTTPAITLNVPTASATNRGVLSSADWTTFNSKQNALTNPITGTGTSGQVAYFNGTTSVTGESNLFWDATNDRLGIKVSNPIYDLDVLGPIFARGDGGVSIYIAGDRAIRNSFGAGANSYLDLGTVNFRNGNGVSSNAKINVYGNGYFAGNLLLNNNTDGGEKLQVTGTSRFTGTTATDGGQLGSELLTSANWTTTGWTGDYSTGFTHTVGNTNALSNTLAAVTNTYYQITYTVTNRTAGSFTLAFGGYSGAGLTATGAVGPRATSTGNLVVTPTTDFNGTVVISIKAITQGSALVSFASSGGTVTNEVRLSTSNTNTFQGVNAGSRISTGLYNIFIGNGSGQNNTSGQSNTFVGFNSGLNNSIGQNNSAYSANSLLNNINGSGNSAFGLNALQINSSGSFNCAFGLNSLQNNSTSGDNSAFGVQSLLNITTGGNTAVGREAGRYAGSGITANQTSSNSLYFGYQTRASASGNTNEVVIGYNVVGLGSNTTILGNSSTVTTGIYGNLLLGSTTDGGQRLQVTGSSLFTGAVSITGNLTVDTNTLFVDSANDRIGFKTTSPSFDLHYINSGANGNLGFYLDHYESSVQSPLIVLRKARGTSASPLAVQTNDALGFLGARGYHSGGAFSSASNATIHFYAEENYTSTAQGSRIEFQTIPNGSITRSVQWTINNAGTLVASDAKNVSFGTTTGTKIGTATTQKIAFWNATPIVQPTTGVASATRVGGGGTALTDTDTFDGYTLAQIAKALRNLGLLA